MFSRILFGIICIVGQISGTAVSAQSVDNYIEQIEQNRQQTCGQLPSPQMISQLVNAIGVEDSLDVKARGLRALSVQPGWRASNQAQTLRQLVVIGREAIALERLAARAVSLADGELLTGLAQASLNNDSFEEFLRSLGDANVGRNRFYLAQIKLTLAEAIQDDIFLRYGDQTLPYSNLSTEDRSRLIEVISIYRDLQTFYREIYDPSNQFSRDLSLDFEYQIALLEFVSAQDRWIETLSGILASENQKSIYDLNADVGHIFVHSFLRPPFSVREVLVEVEAINENCPNPTESGTSTVQRAFSPAIVRSFYNPSQLVEWTCGILSNAEGRLTLPLLATELSKFRNHDYRIVIGHFEGQDVRFSHLSRDDMVVEANQILNMLLQQSVGSIGATSEQTDDGICNEIHGHATIENQFIVGLQEDEGTEGYVFIGTGLPLAEANSLLAEVQSNRSFQGAYLIRPVID